MIRPEIGSKPNLHHFLVVVGTVNEGFSFYGPFDGSNDADHWARQYFTSSSYVLAELAHPDELK